MIHVTGSLLNNGQFVTTVNVSVTTVNRVLLAVNGLSWAGLVPLELLAATAPTHATSVLE